MLLYLKNIQVGMRNEISDVPEVFCGSHFYSLDGLRAISILLVVAFHIVLSYKVEWDVHPFANLGVRFFFVISGFLITTLLLKEKVCNGRISLRKFYIRRIIRIIPVAYLYLFIVSVLSVSNLVSLSRIPIIASFLFLRNYFTGFGGLDHLTTHYWSLSVEEQFYVLFPIVLSKSTRLYVNFLLIVILLSLVQSIVDVRLVNRLFFGVDANYLFFVIGQFQGIAIGSVAAILVFKKVISMDSRLWLLLVNGYRDLATITIFASILLITYFHDKFSFDVGMIQSLLFLIIMLLNITPGNGPVSRSLNGKFLTLVGVTSYSIYIWQQPFTLSLRYISSMGIVSQLGGSIFIKFFISFLSLTILWIVSYASYNLYEKKFFNLKKRFR